MNDILVPISAGELLDKITILRIKSRRMHDAGKLANVRRELEALERTCGEALGEQLGARAGRVAEEIAALEQVNASLWDIEDRIREHEATGRFDAAFIELARAVYLRNDERAAIKRRLNLALGSALIEEKSYRPYGAGGRPPG
ncbi:MAG TPA: DUF6165 family protein [Steroidobacteraceae bacterium]|nr:DUF6165 family protein [Steroidobacteraceae bacterium]